MSYVEKHTVNVTTATGGGFTGYTPNVTGRIAAIRYVKDGTAPLASTADFTITTEDSAQNLWVDTNINASENVYPVLAGNIAGTGAASTLSEVPVYAALERIKIVVAQGGNTKLGSITVVVA